MCVSIHHCCVNTWSWLIEVSSTWHCRRRSNFKTLLNCIMGNSGSSDFGAYPILGTKMSISLPLQFLPFLFEIGPL